ncbi:MAG: response regulator transcription factor [Bacteroidetes bacterium]|nr:response regulator transcription factor [Bacteroidota bacterium]
MKTQGLIRLGICDDHPIFREGIIATLKSFNCYSIDLIVSNATELTISLSRAKILPHVCLITISTLCDAYFHEALKMIKYRWPTVNVIVISTFEGDYIVKLLLQKGAKSYFKRTVDRNELHAIVMSVFYKEYFQLESDTCKKPQPITEAPLLSLKEMEIIRFISKGWDNRIIANELHISIRTVQTHCNNIYKKLSLRTKEQLIVFAFKNGLCD